MLDSAGLRELFDVEVDGVEADRLELDRGGQAAALAERGADVVVTDLGDLVLEGAAAARGGP